MTEFSVLPHRDRLGLKTARLYIDGRWTDSTADDVWTHVHPATNEEVTTIVDATAADVDRCVAAARRAFDEGPWPRMKARERRLLLQPLVQMLREESSRLSELATLENGMPLSFTRTPRISADIAADIFDYHNGWIDKLGGETIPQYNDTPDLQYMTFREPVGVVGVILPWNGPFLQMANKIAPALAVGCTVVLKPSEYAGLTSLAMAELIDRLDLPPGVFNVVTGVGTTSGKALVEHPGVDKVSFTGSRVVGGLALAAAGPTIKRVTLELGGKSAAVVFPDADVRKAGRTVMDFLSKGLTGQMCTSQTRAIVHADCYDEFLEGALESVRGVKFGDPFDLDTTSAAMINTKQVARVMDYIEGAQSDGAKLLVGGDRPGGDLAGGNFVNPTIFTEVDNRSRLAREEVFGPVLAVERFTDEDEAVRLANDSEYGLGGGLYTRDAARAMRVAKRLRTGAVGVNNYTFAPNSPIGGFKTSGIGREGGRAAIEAYTEIKAIMIDLGA